MRYQESLRAAEYFLQSHTGYLHWLSRGARLASDVISRPQAEKSPYSKGEISRSARNDAAARLAALELARQIRNEIEEANEKLKLHFSGIKPKFETDSYVGNRPFWYGLTGDAFANWAMSILISAKRMQTGETELYIPKIKEEVASMEALILILKALSNLVKSGDNPDFSAVFGEGSVISRNITNDYARIFLVRAANMTANDRQLSDPSIIDPLVEVLERNLARAREILQLLQSAGAATPPEGSKAEEKKAARLAGFLEFKEFPAEMDWSGKVYNDEIPRALKSLIWIFLRQGKLSVSETKNILLVGGTKDEVKLILQNFPEANITVVNLGRTTLLDIHQFIERTGPAANIRLNLIDASQMGRYPEDFKAGSYDFIYAGNVDHSVFVREDEAPKILPRIALEEARLVKPGGIIAHIDTYPEKYLPALMDENVFEAEGEPNIYVFTKKIAAARLAEEKPEEVITLDWNADTRDPRTGTETTLASVFVPKLVRILDTIAQNVFNSSSLILPSSARQDMYVQDDRTGETYLYHLPILDRTEAEANPAHPAGKYVSYAISRLEKGVPSLGQSLIKKPKIVGVHGNMTLVDLETAYQEQDADVLMANTVEGSLHENSRTVLFTLSKDSNDRKGMPEILEIYLPTDRPNTFLRLRVFERLGSEKRLVDASNLLYGAGEKPIYPLTVESRIVEGVGTYSRRLIRTGEKAGEEFQAAWMAGARLAEQANLGDGQAIRALLAFEVQRLLKEIMDLDAAYRKIAETTHTTIQNYRRKLETQISSMDEAALKRMPPEIAQQWQEKAGGVALGFTELIQITRSLRLQREALTSIEIIKSREEADAAYLSSLKANLQQRIASFRKVLEQRQNALNEFDKKMSQLDGLISQIPPSTEGGLAANGLSAEEFQHRFQELEKLYPVKGYDDVTHTEKGLYFPSTTKDVIRLFKLAGIQPGQRGLDLGSGDGRILSIGALLFGAVMEGWEGDSKLHEEADEKKRHLLKLYPEVPDRNISNHLGDFMDDDWSRFDFVYYFYGASLSAKTDDPDPKVIAKLASLKPGTKVLVSYRTGDFFEKTGLFDLEATESEDVGPWTNHFSVYKRRASSAPQNAARLAKKSTIHNLPSTIQNFLIPAALAQEEKLAGKAEARIAISLNEGQTEVFSLKLQTRGERNLLRVVLRGQRPRYFDVKEVLDGAKTVSVSHQDGREIEILRNQAIENALELVTVDPTEPTVLWANLDIFGDPAFFDAFVAQVHKAKRARTEIIQHTFFGLKGTESQLNRAKARLLELENKFGLQSGALTSLFGDNFHPEFAQLELVPDNKPIKRVPGHRYLGVHIAQKGDVVSYKSLINLGAYGSRVNLSNRTIEARFREAIEVASGNKIAPRVLKALIRGRVAVSALQKHSFKPLTKVDLQEFYQWARNGLFVLRSA